MIDPGIADNLTTIGCLVVAIVWLSKRDTKREDSYEKKDALHDKQITSERKALVDEMIKRIDLANSMHERLQLEQGKRIELVEARAETCERDREAIRAELESNKRTQDSARQKIAYLEGELKEFKKRVEHSQTENQSKKA